MPSTLSSLPPQLLQRLEAIPDVLARVGGGVALGDGRAVMLRALRERARPTPPMSLIDWAEEHRMVAAESGSSRPGEWRNATAPYLTEIMECLDFRHPARRVTVKGAKQTGKSEVGVNLFGWIVDQAPSPMVIYLPSIEEAQKYERLKIQPTIDATEVLAAKISERKSRDEDASTGSFKRFKGGWCLIAGANSSKALQMISVRVIICEEVTEWPWEVGGRGDPVTQAEGRLTVWEEEGTKQLLVSTPGIAGVCRISEFYDDSDQRRLYLPCPQCGTYQRLSFERLQADREHGARMVCARQGCVIPAPARRGMLAKNVWLKSYPAAGGGDAAPDEWIGDHELERFRARSSDGREPGFHLTQLHSAFVSWSKTLREIEDAGTDTTKLKALTQQVKGEAYEEKADAPDEQKLAKLGQAYPLRRLHPDAVVLTGFCDVQGKYLQWRVYAWGPGWTARVVDYGRIAGDPATPEPWKELARVVERRYPNPAGKLWPVDAFGVDTGYVSNQVYKFCRAHPRVYATDGRGDPKAPAIAARPSLVDVDYDGAKVAGGCELWPVGTWTLKLEAYAAFRKTLEGVDAQGRWPAGALIPHRTCDLEFWQQATAEVLTTYTQAGKTRRGWVMRKGIPHNEELDIFVGARALAYHLGVDELDEAGWARLRAERLAAPPTGTLDLFAPLAAPASVPDDDAETAPLPAPTPDAPSVPPAPPAERRSPAGPRVISRGIRRNED
ncbi:hypothetical protein GAY33_05195 [Azospirillum brasilense]|uniref:phage terminase large subunit family protein n=1 Tax=Azospirillum argentinense TaxID=2970906 RepID=UPI001909419D|nr:terminase gpA endonuclease subunit [Azospirillum argentinense]MBK3798632.1 hypothetical protein [Azospirillum argentinense]